MNELWRTVGQNVTLGEQKSKNQYPSIKTKIVLRYAPQYYYFRFNAFRP